MTRVNEQLQRSVVDDDLGMNTKGAALPQYFRPDGLPRIG